MIDHQNTTAADQIVLIYSARGVDEITLAPGESLTTGRDGLEAFASPRAARERRAVIEKDPAYHAAEARRLREPRAALADYRWQKEVGGAPVPGAPGMTVRSDRDSRASLIEAHTAVAAGLLETPVRWKHQDGSWSDLAAVDLANLVAITGAHVKACFLAEEAVEAVLLAAPDPAAVDIAAEFEAAYAAGMEE